MDYPYLQPCLQSKLLSQKLIKNIAIKISDRGGGASLEQQQKWEAYLFSSGDAAPAENLNNPISVPMARYGYGKPLTKVMARYLGGDIETRSIEDYGTDVYIYLQNCPETSFEGFSILKSVNCVPFKIKIQLSIYLRFYIYFILL